MDNYKSDNIDNEQKIKESQEYLEKLKDIKQVINAYKEQIYHCDVNIYNYKNLKERNKNDLVKLKPVVKKYKKALIPVVIFSLITIVSIVLTIINPTDLIELSLVIGTLFTFFTTAALVGTVLHDEILYKDMINSIDRLDENIKRYTSKKGEVFAKLLDYTKVFPEDDLHEDITNLTNYINSLSNAVDENNTKRSNLLEQFANTKEGEEYLNSNYEHVDIGNKPMIKTLIREE